MIRHLLFALLCALPLSAQTTVVMVASPPPCEPGALIFGIIPCPPVEEHGVLFHIRDESAPGLFQVTVEIEGNVTRSAFASNNAGAEWHSAFVVTGRKKIVSFSVRRIEAWQAAAGSMRSSGYFAAASTADCLTK